MFVGDVGRPDLLEEAAGEAGSREESARALCQSIQKFGELDDFLEVLPGHGAGSSCGKAIGSIPFSTVGYEKRSNPSVSTALNGDEASFVDEILAGQPAPPMYFARMKNTNRDGVPLYSELPQVSLMQSEELPEALTAELENRPVILDTRSDRTDFAAHHLIGSIYAPFGALFSEAAGSYLNPDHSLFLLLESKDQLEDCVRQLVRIGLDKIKGAALASEALKYPGCNPLIQQIPTVSIQSLPPEEGKVLDVRSSDEYAKAHVPGAINVPHTRIVADAGQLPDKETPLSVHCGSGMTASLACAALARMGYQVTLADGLFSGWKEQAGKIATE